MRRTFVLLVLAACALLAGDCGTAGSGTSAVIGAPGRSNQSPAGVRAAGYALLSELERGDVKATCAMVVAADQARCAPTVIELHALTSGTFVAKAKARIARERIVVSGDRAMWSVERGKAEEALYRNGRWLFQIGAGGSAR
jgi:hypothetical protein